MLKKELEEKPQNYSDKLLLVIYRRLFWVNIWLFLILMTVGSR